MPGREKDTPMKRRYVTADVFTDRMFGGNPVAVVLDAAGLSAEQMQAVAIEFGYSETTFVLPPRDPSHTAWIRIFTPSREVPFAWCRDFAPVRQTNRYRWRIRSCPSVHGATGSATPALSASRTGPFSLSLRVVPGRIIRQRCLVAGQNGTIRQRQLVMPPHHRS